MSYPAPSTSIYRNNRPKCNTVAPQSRLQNPNTTSAHILDDYSILNIFYHSRPFLMGKDPDDDVSQGGNRWAGENWWYKLAHVCRRWRKIILESASYLRLCLYCTKGTPIAHMLTHSPSLPLVIEHDYEDFDISTDDEEGLILALQQHRNRIRHIRLRVATNLQKLITAIDGEFPILEYLFIVHPAQEPALILSETLQAPRLYELTLIGFVLPIRSRLLMTAGGLVTFFLSMALSTWIHPNDLLRCLLHMPQLEVLVFGRLFPSSHPHVVKQLRNTPIVTLPNLRELLFQGNAAYLDSLLRWITAPRLKVLDIRINDWEFMFFGPHLQQFIRRTEHPSFHCAYIHFPDDEVYVEVSPREGSEMYRLSIGINFSYLDSQISIIGQVSNTLSQVFHTVERLTFVRDLLALTPGEEHCEIDHADWQRLLGSFSNVKTLCIDDGLLDEFCRCLQLDDGDGLLPELQELTYIGTSDADASLTPFINARQKDGRPVTLVHKARPKNLSESYSEFYTHNYIHAFTLGMTPPFSIGRLASGEWE